MADSPDRLIPLKHIGYCWAHLPPHTEDVTYRDLIAHARFSLCRLTHRLLKDEIWDTYTNEELLSEYFAHIYTVDSDAKDAFENDLRADSTDIVDWFDKMIEENRIELEAQAETLDLEDNISFSPDSMGEE